MYNQLYEGLIYQNQPLFLNYPFKTFKKICEFFKKVETFLKKIGLIG
jgi:hypothetical protein